MAKEGIEFKVGDVVVSKLHAGLASRRAWTVTDCGYRKGKGSMSDEYTLDLVSETGQVVTGVPESIVVRYNRPNVG